MNRINITFLCFYLLFTLVSSTFSISREVGPYNNEPKSEPRFLISNTESIFEVSDLDVGCGFRVTSRRVLSQIPKVSKTWTIDCTGGYTTVEFLAGFYEFNSQLVSIVYRKDAQIQVMRLTSDAFTQVSASTVLNLFPNPSITSTAAETFYYSNDRSIQELASARIFNAAPNQNVFETASNGLSIFLIGEANTQLFILKLDPFGNFNSPVTTNFTPLSSPSVTFFNALTEYGDSDFFYRNSIRICGTKIRLILASDDLKSFEVRTFYSNLTEITTEKIVTTLGASETVVDFSCDILTGKFYVLKKDDSVNPPTFSVQSYSSELTIGSITNVSPSQITGAPFISILSLPNGGLYLHSEIKSGSYTQQFGYLYTECSTGEFGSDCSTCTCINGVCDNGEFGTGKCSSCNTNYAGSNCDILCNCPNSVNDVCDSGINGDGHCICSDINAVGFFCDSCKPGYYKSTNCTICPIGYYCVNGSIFSCPTNTQTGMSDCIPPTPPPTTTPTPTEPNNPTSTPTNSDQNPARYDPNAFLAIVIVYGVATAIVIIGTFIFNQFFLYDSPKAKPIEYELRS